jgi:hypothetical protein
MKRMKTIASPKQRKNAHILQQLNIKIFIFMYNY